MNTMKIPACLAVRIAFLTAAEPSLDTPRPSETITSNWAVFTARLELPRVKNKPFAVCTASANFVSVSSKVNSRTNLEKDHKSYINSTQRFMSSKHFLDTNFAPVWVVKGSPRGCRTRLRSPKLITPSSPASINDNALLTNATDSNASCKINL